MRMQDATLDGLLYAWLFMLNINRYPMLRLIAHEDNSVLTSIFPTAREIAL